MASSVLLLALLNGVHALNMVEPLRLPNEAEVKSFRQKLDQVDQYVASEEEDSSLMYVDHVVYNQTRVAPSMLSSLIGSAPTEITQTHDITKQKINPLYGRRWDPKKGLPRKIIFFTHHKTGSALMTHLMEGMSIELGYNRNQIEYKHHDFATEGLGAFKEKNGGLVGPKSGDLKKKFVDSEISPCSAKHFGMYANIDKWGLSKLIHQCPGFRAVHLIRDPMSVTASGYLYHKAGNQDIPVLYRKGAQPQDRAATGAKLLKDMSLEEGLRTEALAEASSTLPEMAEAHDILKGMSNVLTLHLEDFYQDFDKTSNLMFSFLIGEKNRLVEPLVKMAQKEDVKRWPAEKLARKQTHVAKVEEKDKVMETLVKMKEEGVPEIMKLAEFEERLGYTKAKPKKK